MAAATINVERHGIDLNHMNIHSHQKKTCYGWCRSG